MSQRYDFQLQCEVRSKERRESGEQRGEECLHRLTPTEYSPEPVGQSCACERTMSKESSTTDIQEGQVIQIESDARFVFIFARAAFQYRRLTILAAGFFAPM